ncbi:MAG: 50S ribosomal protein L25 [Candidatus Delongbacteria bacterium]
MGAITLEALNRDRLGKGGARTTRRGELVPVVVYGKNLETRHLSVKAHALEMALQHHARVVELKTADGALHNCLIRDIQRHPVSEAVLHVDFMAVENEQRVVTELPVVLIGNPIGVKQGGQVRRLINKVRVSCKVSDIPAFFEIDITNLEAGGNVLVRDLGTPTLKLLNPDHVAVVQITKMRTK